MEALGDSELQLHGDNFSGFVARLAVEQAEGGFINFKIEWFDLVVDFIMM